MPVGVGLLDPITVYQCPNPSMKISELLNADHFRVFMKHNLSQWGLDYAALSSDKRPSFLPTVDDEITIAEWSGLKDTVMPIPTIVYYLKSGHSREDIINSKKSIENERHELAEKLGVAKRDLQICLDETQQLRVQLQAAPDSAIVDKVETPQESPLSANEAVQLLVQKFESVELAIAKLNQAHIDETARQEVRVNSQSEIRKDEIDKQHKRIDAVINEFGVPIRQLRIRMLLEMYRDYLKDKYFLNFNEIGFSGKLENLIDPKKADAIDAKLIPLVKSSPGSMYAEITSQLRATVNMEQMALTITQEHDSTRRQLFLEMFRLVYGKDAENLALT